MQQETLHRRGHKDDPLYRVRRTLMTGVEHLTEKQKIRLEKHLPADDPKGEVHLAWQAYQRLRAIYHATSPETGRRLAEQLIDVLHTCPIPELARLGRTLRQWGSSEIWVGELAGGQDHPLPVVARVAEPAGDAAVELDDPVDGLGAAVVGAAGGEVGQELRRPGPECSAESGDLGDWAGVERLQHLRSDLVAVPEVVGRER